VKRTLWAAVGVLALAAPAEAQFMLGGALPPAVGAGPAHHGGSAFRSPPGFSYHRPGFRVGGFAGGYYSRSIFLSPAWPGFPVFPPVAQWTPFGWTPGFLEPGWGVGPGWGFSPPVVVQPIILAGNNDLFGNDDPVAAGGLPPRHTTDPPGDFLAIRPKKDLPPGAISPDVPRVAAAPRPAKPAIAFDPFAAKRVTAIDKPDPNPLKEAARLLKLGREAFVAEEYGKAAEQFEQAAAVDPKAALPHFLRAQALLAAGGYGDAVGAICAGLALDPAWPAGTFNPIDLYGPNPGTFTEHMAELRGVIAANPGEATLEFLLGYELWFTGQKTEAKKWFAAAEKRLAAPGPIALFK
jgi:hypothetical protein